MRTLDIADHTEPLVPQQRQDNGNSTIIGASFLLITVIVDLAYSTSLNTHYPPGSVYL